MIHEKKFILGYEITAKNSHGNFNSFQARQVVVIIMANNGKTNRTSNRGVVISKNHWYFLLEKNFDCKKVNLI